ncbi:NmrA multi-domain protein [Pyrenophora tritici-repentis]|uniref:NmrA multi-domain protein n=3 Tax=Pyrenophora tritici-repentis TaxID=45151 RepID=A0A2W1GAU8_9PLEO|nr:isoflavone reductase family protein [Pyrenophora tritici-repentis Pt-1C-BFP]KAF7453156.1 NmrA multi-domain protein [Pyrenophora tritici-repentis]EDU39614.1 isoflavone reductase family protein [Pyrenophora tritici-repentis Pt-1C-BFP]KAG9377386.1 NmrA multi-domain protein [Pyrenophora tritici-repentis]KAI0582340.1 NmrA multi-domain protein [Pyrenophora tritici-repentis]KAI0591422.1 NmrA multi-domain protein [Pyrenophora tritici-repentis]
MAIEKVVILGNWELCLTIIAALLPSKAQSTVPQYHITVLTYPSQTLSLPSHVSASDVVHKKSDFSTASLLGAFSGQDIIISTMSGGDSDLQIRIVDAAVAAGVKRFIPDEFGHDTLNRSIQTRIPKYAGRATVIDYLQHMSKSFEWTAIATGYTLDTNLVSGNMGLDMEWYSATIHGIGTEQFAASSLEKVGSVVACTINHWDEVKNQYIYAAGVITSTNEVLRSAEKATGRTFTVGHYNVEESILEGQQRIERGYPDSGMFLLERSILYDEQVNASMPFKTQSMNEKLGLSPESVEAIVEKAYHDMKHRGKSGCACST